MVHGSTTRAEGPLWMPGGHRTGNAGPRLNPSREQQAALRAACRHQVEPGEGPAGILRGAPGPARPGPGARRPGSGRDPAQERKRRPHPGDDGPGRVREASGEGARSPRRGGGDPGAGLGPGDRDQGRERCDRGSGHGRGQYPYRNPGDRGAALRPARRRQAGRGGNAGAGVARRGEARGVRGDQSPGAGGSPRARSTINGPNSRRRGRSTGWSSR